MAWTPPRTWVVGEVVTASIMNTHVRDNLNALGDPTTWTAYTPALTGTSNPSVGAGSITGRYKILGKTVFVEMQWTFGSGASLGTGTWGVSLPNAVTSNLLVAQMIIGFGRYRTNAGSYVPAFLEAGVNSSVCNILVQTPGGTTPNLARVTNAVPSGMTAGDAWVFSAVYEMN